MSSPPPPPPLSVIRGSLVARRLRLPDDSGRGTNVVATGRTGSGKTTLANRLLGVDYFLSDGRQDCTREVNHIRFPGGLTYSDLPGVCSDDLLENVNRLALGLPQVDDAPPADALTVATYSPDQPPARDHLTAKEAGGSPLAPDLILYLVAADKQFTSDDRRYLLDLLSRHAKVVYVLNVFATSPPSGPNVQDLVSRITAAHRRARPGAAGPRIVPFDCRTGEGLSDLLDAARQELGGAVGEHFADVLGDVERATPRLFARELTAYLVGQADGVQTASGPADTLHPLRVATLAAFDLVNSYAPSQPGRGSSSIAHLPIAAAQAPDEPSQDGPASEQLATELLTLADRIADEVLPRAGRIRDTLRADVESALREERGAHDRRLDVLQERRAALDAESEAIDQEAEALRRRNEAFSAGAEEHAAAVLELRTRIAMHEAEIGAHNDEMESHRDQVDELNDVIAEVAHAGGLDDSGSARLRLACDRAERAGRNLNRRADALNSEGWRLQTEIDDIDERAQAREAERARLNQEIDAFNNRVDALRDDRSRLRADLTALEREQASTQLANDDYLAVYYRQYRELGDRLEAQRDRVASTRRRCGRCDPLLADVHARLSRRLHDEAREIADASTAMRRSWCRFRAARLVDRQILDGVVDHFDEAGEARHRGSTFRPLGIAAAAALLASAVAAADLADPFRAFDALRVAIEQHPGSLLDCEGLIEALEERIAAAIR